jgi:hypothetical protein
MAQKSLDQLVDQLKTKGKLKINEELKRRYLNAKTDAERNSIMEEIQQDLANQIPATLKEQWTALRYLSMLGNLRTQSRNLAGNASMGLAVSVKDLIATGIESLAYIASDGQFERTKALLPGKELRKAAAKDYDFVSDIIATGGKFNDANNASSAFVRGVMEKRTIFRGKILAGLEAYRKGTNLAMAKGDVMFSKAAYAKALAGYLKAHGVTETDFSKINETLLEKARLYAVQEAQEATFHDINAVSEFVTRRYRGENKAGRALSLALDGIMPFRKTPANILVRAWEYSPLGITNALVMSAKAMSKNSDVTGAEIVNTWSEDDLTRILRDYGEEKWARQIARVICDRRADAPIGRTAQLVSIIDAAIPKKFRQGDGSHPARRTFQALRIAVNDELEPLEPSLRALTGLLNPGGRLCVITFHSLEDRIVKQAFASLATGCTCPKDFPICVCGHKPTVKIITRKPILPSKTELEENPRSRSAKLRVAEKT